MPKKFQGENTKSAVAKARKAEKAADEKCKKEKAAADEYWKEDDKLIVKKIQRKEDKERKKQEDAQKKLEKKLLEEQEENEIAPPPVQVQKITQYQLMKRNEEMDAANKKTEKEKTHLDTPLVENLNRTEEEQISASGLDAALAALSASDASATSDKHPEKRVAAAFRSFEEQRMPQLKKENPNMRLSQLKQLLRKEWQKCPQNPLTPPMLSASYEDQRLLGS